MKEDAYLNKTPTVDGKPTDVFSSVENLVPEFRNNLREQFKKLSNAGNKSIDDLMQEIEPIVPTWLDEKVSVH